jgi:hypothetical protein
LPKECETEKKENTAFLSENALRACSMELAGGDLRPDEQSSPPLMEIQNLHSIKKRPAENDRFSFSEESKI